MQKIRVNALSAVLNTIYDAFAIHSRYYCVLKINGLQQLAVQRACHRDRKRVAVAESNVWIICFVVKECVVQRFDD